MPPLSRKVIIGLLIGATILFVIVLVMGFTSGNAYTTAYDKLPLPEDLNNATCKFGTVPGTTKRKLECTTTFKATVNTEMAALSKTFDDAGYTLDRNSVQDDGTGVVWAENGTWLIQINVTSQKTKDGSVGHYHAVMERGGDFGQFN